MVSIEWFCKKVHEGKGVNENYNHSCLATWDPEIPFYSPKVMHTCIVIYMYWLVMSLALSPQFRIAYLKKTGCKNSRFYTELRVPSHVCTPSTIKSYILNIFFSIFLAFLCPFWLFLKQHILLTLKLGPAQNILCTSRYVHTRERLLLW